MLNTFYNLCNIKYGIAERSYLSLRCIKLQIFSVLASTWVWEVRGLITQLFKLDPVSSTARHFSNVSPPYSFTYFDIIRDNNEYFFFENLFALPNDARTC